MGPTSFCCAQLSVHTSVQTVPLDLEVQTYVLPMCYYCFLCLFPGEGIKQMYLDLIWIDDMDGF